MTYACTGKALGGPGPLLTFHRERYMYRTLTAIATALWCSTLAIAQSDGANLRSIKIIATGGTIAGEAATSAQAGYTSGQVGVETLIKAVPTPKNIARVSGEQISNVG